MPLFRDIQNLGSTVALGCLFSCGAGTLAIYKLGQYWDPEELIAMGAAIVTVSACGRYVLVQFRRRVANSMSLTDFLALVKQYFTTPPQSAEEPFDWVEMTTNRYHSRRRSYALPVGLNENGRFVEVPMEKQDAHLFVSGMTGSGKSVLVNQIVLSAGLSGLYQVCLVGRTMKDYSLLLGMKNVYGLTLGRQAESLYEDELPQVLESAYREIVRRQTFLETRQKRQMGDVRADQRPQSILLIVDEFTNAAESIGLKKGNRYMGALFSNAIRIAQEGRAVGVHLVLIGQRPTSMVPKSLRAQMVNVTYKTANSQEAFWATGSKNSGAEELAVGNHRSGEMSEIAIVGGYINEKAFVPITSDRQLAQAAAKDESRMGEEPHWLHGFRSPVRTESVPRIQVMEATHAAYPAGTKGQSPEVGGDLVPDSAGTGTAGTKLIDPINAVSSWASELFDSHEDFAQVPKCLTRQKVVEIALCKVIGLTGNATMRAIFNGNRKQEYRDWVNMIWGHMDQANVAF